MKCRHWYANIFTNKVNRFSWFDISTFQSLSSFTYPVALPEVYHYGRAQTPRWIQTSSWQRNLEQINEKIERSYVVHRTSVHCWVHKVTRKHSSRMRTARWPTICALVATRCQHQGAKQDPQVIRFEQVSSVGHRMSLAGRPGPELGGWVSLYSEVSCWCELVLGLGGSLYSEV